MEMDIVLLAPKKLSRSMGNSVQEIEKNVKLNVAVDDRKLLPHITLLHINLQPGQVKNVLEALRFLAKKHSKINLEFGANYMGASIFRNFFHLGLKKSAKLYDLHESVVETISPIRNGKVPIPVKAKNSTQKSYFTKYGVGNILKFFNPHFTLGELKNVKDEEFVLKFLGARKFPKFSVDRIGLAKVNNKHQLIKIVKEFKLK